MDAFSLLAFTPYPSAASGGSMDAFSLLAFTPYPDSAIRVHIDTCDAGGIFTVTLPVHPLPVIALAPHS
jgi:hypothetical protein